MAKINIMISSSINGRGGISTVVNGYRSAGFFDRWDVRYVPTSTSASSLPIVFMLPVFLVSVLKLLLLFIFNDVGLVHIHMASRGSYLRKSILVRIAKHFKAKVILHLHGGEFQEFYLNECTAYKQSHIRNTFNMSDKVIVLSSQWFDWVKNIVTDNTKICIVYNSVHEINMAACKESNQVLLFLGRLGRSKGVDDLINAYSKIANIFPKSRLDLGGDGDLQRYKKQSISLGIQNQVNFLGWVSGKDKNQCLANATIYCLPSYNEGFPMGVLEAMSSGTAVIASTAGGIPDAIEDGKEGLLVEAGDVTALANALTLMLNDDKLRKKYEYAAKEKYRNIFSSTVIVPQLEDIYKELLD